MENSLSSHIHSGEKLYSPHGGQVMWFIISVKESNLFKIAESKLHNFKQVGVFYWNEGPHYLFSIRTL